MVPVDDWEITSSEEFEVAGSNIRLWVQIPRARKKCYFKAKKLMKIIGRPGGVYKCISYQPIKQLYILCLQPIFEYASPV